MIECGAQATGGNYSFFTEVPGLERAGFPWAEVAADGSCVIGKHDGTGGEVSVGTVTSQLLYEIGVAGLPRARRHGALRHDRARGSSGAIACASAACRASRRRPRSRSCMNELGGFRNDSPSRLTGLDIEAKARLVEAAFWGACPLAPAAFDSVTVRLVRTDKPDPATNERGGRALARHAQGPRRAQGRARACSTPRSSSPSSTIPGFFMVGGAPGPAAPYGVYQPARRFRPTWSPSA